MNPNAQGLRRKASLRQERGSILVICVVLAALGTVGVAAWIGLLDARGHQAEATIQAVERRVAQENGRALARRALYASHLHADAANNEQKTHQLPDGLGSVTLSAFGEVPLAASAQTRMSRSGATPMRSYSVDVDAVVGDGAGTQSWQFQMRSSHPALDGELLVIHPQADHDSAQPLLSGSITVRGRATIWDAIASDLPSGFLADEVNLPDAFVGAVVLRNSDGDPVLPLNYPFRRQTTGFFSDGGPYAGGLDVVAASPNPHNSYLARTSGGNPVEIKGNQKQAKSKGPSNKPPKETDDEVSNKIFNLPPAELVSELIALSPLSSNTLKKVLEKDNPPLTTSQLRQVLNAQEGLPDDVLEEIAAEHEERFGLEDIEIADWYDQSDTYHVSGGNGQAHLFLDRTQSNRIVLRDVRRLKLFGQPNTGRFESARAMPPLLIVVVNDGGVALERIDCFHRNGRPFVLAMHHPRGEPGAATINFKGNDSFPSWRAILEADNTALRFETGSGAAVTLVGGIRTNRRVQVASGSLVLARDPEGDALAPLLSRNAWIESFRQ